MPAPSKHHKVKKPVQTLRQPKPLPGRRMSVMCAIKKDIQILIRERPKMLRDLRNRLHHETDGVSVPLSRLSMKLQQDLRGWLPDKIYYRGIEGMRIYLAEY